MNGPNEYETSIMQNQIAIMSALNCLLQSVFSASGKSMFLESSTIKELARNAEITDKLLNPEPEKEKKKKKKGGEANA